MPFGVSLVLIAVGAILEFAVSASVAGVSIATIGLILMIVGVVGLLASLLVLNPWVDRRDAVVRERYVDRGAI